MSQHGGRHELGQNFLIDRTVIAQIDGLVSATSGPIVEIGSGDGALTIPLSRTGRLLTAVEIDRVRARKLANRTAANVTVVCEDFLDYRLPPHPHVIVGNVPFHLTTSILRKTLAANSLESAILLVQWEVARRRAGVGGATMLTASWWPWYEFTLHGRVPARAFRPMPTVDGGLLQMTRRAVPLTDDQRGYQAFVKRVFTGRGRGMREILVRTEGLPRRRADRAVQAAGVAPYELPKDLRAQQWARLWELVRSDGAQRIVVPRRYGR